jgi:beta-glucosidase
MKLTQIRQFSPLRTAISVLLIGASALAQDSRPDLSKPQERKGDERFARMHQDFLARAKQGDVGLLFLGDSITAGWMTKAKDLFQSEYAKYNAANFGIGGDHVYGVLWRVTNGELENIAPKVIVLMIGTNDTALNTGDDIAAGVEHLVKTIRSKSPNSKVLLLAILPRGAHPNRKPSRDPADRMRDINTANARLAKLDNGSTVRFLDLGPKFLDSAGKIPADLMPDQLHPSKKGYEVWADAMRPKLEEMMK